MKKIQVLIITLVIILLLGCATFATLYFATDIFKSNKDMFYKYISQISVGDTLVANKYSKYQERLKNEDNTNKGNVSISVKGNNEEVINEEFDFETKSKPGEDFASAKIDMKQNDEKKLTIDYLRNEDLYGLRFEDVIKQYIVLENNNLKEFAQKLGIENTDNIPNKVEIQDKEVMSEEEQKAIEQILTKYMNIAIEQIPNENYSKLKKESITLDDKELSADGYQLTINSDLLKEIFNQSSSITKMNSVYIYDAKLEQAIANVRSNFVLSKHKRFVAVKLSETEFKLESYKETIQSSIDAISQENIKINISLKVYKQGKKTVKLVGIIESEEGNGKIELSVEKIQDKYDFLLDITSDDSKTNIIFNLNKNVDSQEKEDILCSVLINQDNEEVANATIEILREGRLDSQNIKDSFKIDINFSAEDMNINIAYDNTKNFGGNIETEKFKEDDYAIINQFEGDQINNLIRNLITMIYEKIDEESTIFGSIINANIGLVNSAQNAVEKTRKESDREMLLLAVIENIDYYENTVDFEKLDENLPEGFTGNNGRYTSKYGNVFSVSSDGNIENITDSN